ncbi:type 2 lactosamine alpha-2,3-sialyltransferase isoform X2 [Rhinatrema bivittatum]|uniref:type 2 lactosamine alpha-2,3-sialyltransferase isoform X2 n=1 Tax=Rhinatrema bivittatum TaxID=194408 RepID=UPI00112606CF|nr:type 2 lactosamine alpha-2,3-sialyltransferase isoform X2 [Rhinatrema bivittatum]
MPKVHPVMRKFLLAVTLIAVFLHFILHCILQKTSFNWVPTVNVDKIQIIETCFNQNFRFLLNMSDVEPFLCSDNFQQQNIIHGNNKFDLPYGVRKGERFFKVALSKLENCHLPAEVEKFPCKRCIVVGNGGILRNKTLGKKIDSYDIIIRMNDAPVIGYEQDVGRKTTFRLCYPESVFSDPIHYDPNTTVVLLTFKPHDVKWLSDLLQHRRAKPTHPTTGLIAIALALHVCNEVHIAGFKYNFTSQNSSLHYYGNETMSLMMENAYHNISAEQRLLGKFIENKTIINLTQD